MKLARKAAAAATIVLTGERHNDHYEVIVNGQTVELTACSLKVLIELILGRAGSGTGFVPINPVDICRLRQSLEKAAEPGTRRALIETGGSEEYRLTIPRDQLCAQVAVREYFAELVELQVVSASQAKNLRGLAGEPLRHLPTPKPRVKT